MLARLRAPLAVLCTLAAAATAQTPARDTAKALPGVTTTATRNASPILTTPLAITKVTEADLRATSGYGIEDALKLVPGVIAQSRYGTSDVRLIIRGYGARGAGDRSNSGTSRGVRVLLDGFPETEPDGRTAFDDIDLQTAEAVEVIRSNAGSTYGNAAGGVVSLMSVPGPGAPDIDVQPIVGGFGLRRVAARTRATLGTDGTMWATYTNSTFDGWRKHSDSRRVLLNAGAVGNIADGTRLGVYLVAANNLMRIPGPLTQAEYDADPTQANAAYATRDERRYNRQGRLGLSLDHQLNATTSVSTMFYVNPKYLQRSERGTYRDFTRYHLGGNLIGRRSQTLGKTRNRFTVGADQAYQDGSIQFYALTNNTRGALSDNKGEGAHNMGFFAQDEVAVNDKLNLLLGARYDRVAYNYRTFFNPAATLKSQSKEFDRVSPKLGASWKVSATSALYANVGGGIEVPAGNETDQPPTTGSAGPIPGALLNPLLDAISSTTYEIGYKSVGRTIGGGAAIVGYDLALYTTSVANEIIPYNGGRYYQTAAEASRKGLELALNGTTRAGIFGNASFTYNDHTYSTYMVDSSVIASTNTGRADLSGNEVMGVPTMFWSGELGTELPFYRNLRVRGGIEHSDEYFADDKNSIRVPSFTIFNATLELRNPIVARNGVALRGFFGIRNLADTKYVGSAFLNPDNNAAGQPMVFEPGAPRSVTVSLSLGRQ